MISGVVTLVMRSPDDTPLSDAGSKPGAPTEIGATVSITTVSASDRRLGRPVALTALATMSWVPFASTVVLIDHNPDALALAEPITVAPSNKVTVAMASADPVSRGVASRVTLSTADCPVSDPTVRSGTLGVADSTVTAVFTRRAACPLLYRT